MSARRGLDFSRILVTGLMILASSDLPVAQSLKKPALPGGPGGAGPSRWAEIDAFGPGGRLDHAMAYDSLRDRVVLFSGRGNPDGEFGQSGTWEFDGSDWIERAPATSPPWLRNYALAYDSARGRVVLFGGIPFEGIFAGTWEWDGDNWVDRTPATGPPAISGHAMAYDSVRQRVVLFGGIPYGIPYEDGAAETWEWDGIAWVERLPDTSPPRLVAHAMTYDSLRERVVLFGGVEVISQYDGIRHDETWEWDGSTWVDVAIEPNARPSARFDHAMAFDSARGRVVLFGGFSTGYLRDTWELIDGTRWMRASSGGPEERTGPAMVYDSLRERVLLFGGSGYEPRYSRRGGDIWYSDTWEYGGKPWGRGDSLRLGRE